MLLTVKQMDWNSGRMEYWKETPFERGFCFSSPFFHRSSIPTSLAVP
jgi:hypothetical protein